MAGDRFKKIPEAYWKYLGAAASLLSADLRSVELTAMSGAQNVAAPPNGVDDTDAIIDAVTNHKTLQAGTYQWKGDQGIDTDYPWLIGVPGQATQVQLAPGSYLFDSTSLWEATHLENVFFYGGAGVLRQRRTDGNVAGKHVVRLCRFQEFTECAISSNSKDHPYWFLENNFFWGANVTTSMGASISGPCVVNGNAFVNHRVGIKFQAGFANAQIRDNDFIHFTAPDVTKPRTHLWVVPKGDGWQGNVDAGVGTTIEANKFGPENLGSADQRILLAGEGAGTYTGNRLPSTATSGGYVNGLTIRGNVVGSTNDYGTPPSFVTSYTPNFVSSRIVEDKYTGALPPYVLRYADGITPTDRPEVTIGDIQRQWAGATAGVNDQTLLAVNVNPEKFWINTRNTVNPNELIPNY